MHALWVRRCPATSFGDGGQLAELLGVEDVDEVTAHAGNMLGGGPLDLGQAALPEHGERTSGVRRALLSLHQPPGLHAGQLVGEAALGPVEPSGQVVHANAAAFGFGEMDQDHVVGVGQARIHQQVAAYLGAEALRHR